MDISRWPLDKIMELPDWCFGQQWWIGDSVGTSAATTTYFYFTDMPPDVFVVWDIIVSPGGIVAGTRLDVTLCLCAEAPKDQNIRTMTRLLRNFGTNGAFYDMHLPPNVLTHVGPMKTVVEAQNNGIGGALKIPTETADLESSIAVLVSAIPKEVPDWVVSGRAVKLW